MLSRVPATLPALALIGAVALTSCTSGSSGSKSSASSTKATSAAPTGGRSVDPATVAHTLQRGLAGTTSAHLAVSTAVSGQVLTGSGDVTLAQDAIISGANLQQALPSALGSITVVVAGGKTYAKLPSALRTSSGKPWVVLSPDSKSIVVSQLASTVQPILTVASPASLVTFTRSAASVIDLGPSTIGGVATTHYRVIVDAGSLRATVPKSITAGGKSSIPIDMYLDATGRPRQVVGTFSISGQTVTPTIVLSDYDEKVSISAPPASQIGAR